MDSVQIVLIGNSVAKLPKKIHFAGVPHCLIVIAGQLIPTHRLSVFAPVYFAIRPRELMPECHCLLIIFSIRLSRIDDTPDSDDRFDHSNKLPFRDGTIRILDEMTSVGPQLKRLISNQEKLTLDCCVRCLRAYYLPFVNRTYGGTRSSGHGCCVAAFDTWYFCNQSSRPFDCRPSQYAEIIQALLTAVMRLRLESTRTVQCVGSFRALVRHSQ